MQYVKKKDGTIVESQCETVKVTENTLKKLLDTTKGVDYLFYRYRGTNVNDLIQYDDTSSVTSATNMFSYCSNLIEIPKLNTSNVKFFDSMFYYCSSLTTVSLFDTSNATSAVSMFAECNNLTTIPQFNTPNVTNVANIFASCYKLQSVPLLDTSKVTAIYRMFYNCYRLISIPAFDFSNVISTTDIFKNCRSLEEIHCTGLKVSFDISASTKFTESALVEILNNLGTPTSSQTLTMGATNLAKLSDEEKAIATDKGWTLK